jgi:hypothetical protein
MSWLDPLLEQIMNENNPQVVEEAVRRYMVPMTRDVELQGMSNAKDPDRQKIIGNTWLRSQVDAAIQMSAVKTKTLKFKDI